MLLSIAPISAAAHFSPKLVEQTKVVIETGGQLVEKVQTTTFPLFKAGSSLFFCGFGSFEGYRSLTEKAQTSEGFLADIYHKMALSYLGIHGALLIGTGLCTGLEALHAYSVIDLGSLFSRISGMGGMLFLFANFVALQENIAMYERACNIECTTSEKTFRFASWLKESAIWGFLSNLGYITATCLALYGVSTALALLVGVVSTCFGCLKILCDFLAWKKGIHEEA